MSLELLKKITFFEDIKDTVSVLFSRNCCCMEYRWCVYFAIKQTQFLTISYLITHSVPVIVSPSIAASSHSKPPSTGTFHDIYPAHGNYERQKDILCTQEGIPELVPLMLNW